MISSDVVPKDGPRRSYCISALFILGLLALTCCVAIASVCALSALEETYFNHRREGLSEEHLREVRDLWFVGKLLAVVASLLLAMRTVCYSDSIGWRVTCKAAPGPMSPSHRNCFVSIALITLIYCSFPLTGLVMKGIFEACIRGRGKDLEEGWKVLTKLAVLFSVPLTLVVLAKCHWTDPISASEVAPETVSSDHPASKEVKTSNDVRGEDNVQLVDFMNP